MTNASGAEVKDYDYKAFGDVQTQSGTERNEREFTERLSKVSRFRLAFAPV